MVNRVDLINKHFQFLISDYNFQVDRSEFDFHSMGNAIVIFKSPNYGIEVTIDRNQVFISIGEIVDSRKQWFDLTDVINYYTHSENDIYDFSPTKNLGSWDNVVEAQLENLARIVDHFCKPVLRGQLWQKEEINKVKEKRIIAMMKKYGQSA